MELFGFAEVLGDLGWLLKTFGPLLVAVIFFIWRDYRREDKLLTRIEQLENEQRLVILPLVRETTKVIVRNTEMTRQTVKVMERLEHALNR
jgi:hypothetical protein